MINNEDIIVNDFKKYSQYRLDYKINDTVIFNRSMKDIFSLVKNTYPWYCDNFEQIFRKRIRKHLFN